METLLINKDDFLPFRAISDNMDTMKRIDPYIVEAQSIDLFQLLGEDLYFTLVANVSTYLTTDRANVAAWNAAYVAALKLDPQAVKPPRPAKPSVTTEQQPYVNLLQGETYTNKKGVPVVYRGLVPVLVYLSYRRFSNEDNMRSTPSGFVVKTDMNSTPASAKQIAEKAARAETDAVAFYGYAKNFMRDNPEPFKDYYNSCGCGSIGERMSQTRLSAPRNSRRTDRRFY